MSNRVWFITGVTGFVGGELLRRIMLRTDDEVIGLIRAANDDAIQTRIDKLLEGSLGADLLPEHAARFTGVRGDISQPGLGMSDEHRQLVVRRATRLLHNAASVRFDLTLEEARKHNVVGTEGMLELGREVARDGELERFGYVGTCYVAGRRTGVVLADELDEGQEFKNTYEQTKCESEKLIRDAWDELPIVVFRPSIIVGDSRTGRTQSFNVIYWPLQIYAKGMWPDFFIGNLEAPSDVVPVNFVADAMLYLLDQESSNGCCFPLAAGVDKVATNRKIIEMASEFFDRPFPEIISPEDFSDEERIRRYNELSATQRSMIAQGIQYLPYFAQSPMFDNTPTLEALAGTGLEPPAVEDYFLNLFDYCKRSQWGRKPVDD